MNMVKGVLIYALRLFRRKLISTYDDNDGIVKAEASMVLSMIEGELLERGLEINDEEVIVKTTLQQRLLHLKSMFHRNGLVFLKKQAILNQNVRRYWCIKFIETKGVKF